MLHSISYIRTGESISLKEEQRTSLEAFLDDHINWLRPESDLPAGFARALLMLI